MQRLQDKVAVITGGAGAIGKAAARLMLDEGAKVLLVDLNEAALRSAVDELAHEHVAHHVADVTQAEQVQAYAEAAHERWGRIDVFFNNAGVEGVVKAISDYPEETFDQVIAVNVKGVWLGLKYVMPLMGENGGGSIIITSSVAGLQGTPQVSAYVTSKHAVVGLMKVAALEG
ncbi:MAG: SDR family NAD(P)-dependent oxidoreductase, partial [Catalinimonas sp.]